MNLEGLPGLHPVSSFQALRGDPKLVVLVDFSWLLHRSFHAYDLSFPIGGVEVRTSDLYGVLRTVGNIAHKKPSSLIFLVLDGSTKARTSVSPEYKGNREDTVKAEIYRKQEEILRAACLLPNVYVARHPDFEADDVIATFVKAFQASEMEIVIYASDKDFYQLVGERVRMAAKMAGKQFEYVDEEAVVKKFKVRPGQLLMFRSLVGDASDNLPGYPRLPSKLAAKIASEFLDAEKLLDAKPEDLELQNFFAGLTKSQKKWVKKIQEEPDVLRKNFEMMRLRNCGRPGVYRLEGDEAILDKYGLVSIKTLFRSLTDTGTESIHEETM